ncbi:porin family protein [Flavobacterium sp.]|uniref:porin family protein n=1 Tax=Flavobacterium sp. TaxID=239 RepID=UPI00286B2626|nr:porin family protein [Flavobacterium sp.]
MKKIIFASIFLLALSTSVHAQLVKFGLKAGLNYANVTGATLQTDAITSYHAGLVTEIKLGETFALQPELVYSTQGATYKTALEDFKNELGYLSIPVMVKIYLGKTVSLELGPQASFLLSEKKEFDIENSNTFDFAATGGLGFKISKNIFIQGRYVLGLTEISKNADAKNAVVQVSAGIMF